MKHIALILFLLFAKAIDSSSSIYTIESVEEILQRLPVAQGAYNYTSEQLVEKSMAQWPVLGADVVGEFAGLQKARRLLCSNGHYVEYLLLFSFMNLYFEQNLDITKSLQDFGSQSLILPVHDLERLKDAVPLGIFNEEQYKQLVASFERNVLEWNVFRLLNDFLCNTIDLVDEMDCYYAIKDIGSQEYSEGLVLAYGTCSIFLAGEESYLPGNFVAEFTRMNLNACKTCSRGDIECFATYPGRRLLLTAPNMVMIKDPRLSAIEESQLTA